MFLGKGVLQCNFIEIALRHGHSPVKLLHIFRTPFSKNLSGRLLLLKTYGKDKSLKNSIKQENLQKARVS